MKYVIILLFSSFSFIQAQTIDELTGQVSNPSNLLLEEVRESLTQMREDALKEGIDIQVVSGYRSFHRQKQIWDRKYRKYEALGLAPDAIFDKIVEYSTVPGTSRHHWGTEIDVIDRSQTAGGDLLVPSNYENQGPYSNLKTWLNKNASTYGFYEVYTNEPTRSGFSYEPWHFSYQPKAIIFIKKYPSFNVLIKFLRQHELMGMDKISDERLLRYYNEHILGINPQLLPNK